MQDFYNNQPVTTTVDATEDTLIKCMDSIINQNSFTKNDDGTFNLELNDTSFVSCYQAYFSAFYVAPTTVLVNKSDLSFEFTQIKAVDSLGNEVNLQGKFLNATEQTFLTQGIIKSTSAMNFTFSSGTTNMTTDTISKTMLSNQDGVCSFQSTGEVTACQNRNLVKITTLVKVDTSSDTTSETNLSVLTLNPPLKGDVSSPYYTNGTISFVINNWTGTMTYDATADTPPSYLANDGTDTVCGFFGGSLTGTTTTACASTAKVNKMSSNATATNDIGNLPRLKDVILSNLKQIAKQQRKAINQKLKKLNNSY